MLTIIKTNLKNKIQVGGLILPDFKAYYRAILIQCGIGIRMGKQIDRTEESPEVNPHIYGQLLFDKGAEQFSGEIIFLISGAGTTGYLHLKKNLDPYLAPYANINLKWITDLMYNLKL